MANGQGEQKMTLGDIVVTGYPPVYEAIVKKFPEVANMPFVVVTYDGKLYNPSGRELPPYLVTHELVHVKQQEFNGPNVWWELYLLSDEFRLSQELEAYRAEYKHFCQLSKDRNERHSFLNYIATNLSGPLYGNLMTKETAIARITGYL